MRLTTVLTIVVVLLVSLVVTAVAVLSTADFNAFKGDVESVVRESTGRDLKIDGEFKVRVGLTPAVTVNDVRLANAAWGSRPDMVTIRRLDVEVELLPLLTGEIRVKRLVLVGADILLETNAEGSGNWISDATSDAEGQRPTLPHFDSVRIENARIVWHGAKPESADEVTITALDATSPGIGAPVTVSLRGQYGGAPLALDGMLGAPSAMLGTGEPWPFDLRAELAGARIDMKGSARPPLPGAGLDASVSVQGAKLSDLAPLAGKGWPAIGPYRLAMRLTGKEGVWTAANLSVAVGRSTMSAEATADLNGERPMIRIALAAPLIDLNELARQGDREPEEPAAPATAETGASVQAEKPAGPRRIIPDVPLPLASLAAVDAKVALRIARLDMGSLSLSDAAADLSLEGGALTIHPLQATLAGAPIRADLRASGLDGPSPSVSVKLNAEKLDIALLTKAIGKGGVGTGKANLNADLKGRGRDLRSLLAGLSGTSEIVMDEGTVSDDTLNLLSADVINAISPWSPPNQHLRINCLVGRYDIRNGAMTSRAMLFDTDRVAVTGEGGLSLATEEIGFTLVPHAKETSLLKLAVPIRVSGTLANPAIFPDAGYIAKGAVGTVLSLPGDIIDGTIGRILRGTPQGENRCIAALRQSARTVRTTPPRPAQPAGGVGRALQDIGKEIGDGLKSLFGK